MKDITQDPNCNHGDSLLLAKHTNESQATSNNVPQYTDNNNSMLDAPLLFPPSCTSGDDCSYAKIERRKTNPQEFHSDRQGKRQPLCVSDAPRKHGCCHWHRHNHASMVVGLVVRLAAYCRREACRSRQPNKPNRNTRSQHQKKVH